MNASRASWEPARHSHFYAALAANQIVPTESPIIHEIIAANLSASPLTVQIFEGVTQIGTLRVPANDVRTFGSYPGFVVNALAITPSAAADVTVHCA